MEIEKKRICELVDVRPDCSPSPKELLHEYTRRGWQIVDVISEIHTEPNKPSRYLMVILEQTQ